MDKKENTIENSVLNRIFNQDCLNGMKNMPNESIDLILTDPPYNISVENNFSTLKGRKGIDFGEWDKDFDLIGWLEVATEKLKKGGNIVIFNSWQNMGVFTQYLESKGFLVKQMLVWKKSNPMPRNRDRLYVNTCEYAIWATKGRGWTFNRQRETYENAIFDYPVVSSKKRFHPTQKPVKLIEDIIKIHSNENEVILDPFMGSGTTAIACMNTNRNFIGFELDKDYFDIANKRINDNK